MRGMRYLRTEFRLTAIGGTVIALATAGSPILAQQTVDLSQVKTSGTSTRPQRSPDKEVPSLVQHQLPYPGSVQPNEVLQNIKVLVRDLDIAEQLKLPELAMRNADLRVGRVLSVKSILIPGGYLVVELEEPSGRRIANFAMTRSGSYMMTEDLRTANLPRSLNLTDAASRVQGRRGRAPVAIEYEYFHNVAERGVSLCRPLVAVKTEEETVYLNSAGEAFVEEGSEPADGKESRSESAKPPDAAKRLRSLGKW